MDTLYKGTNHGTLYSTALMPPPWGQATGADIVITGACAPQLTNSPVTPSAVSLDPPVPNPFSRMTTFNYTVPAEGQVRLIIYDVLGKQIRSIVEAVQKQGAYTVSFDGSALAGGTYIARLEAAGTVISRMIAVEK